LRTIGLPALVVSWSKIKFFSIKLSWLQASDRCKFWLADETRSRSPPGAGPVPRPSA
jgi:hypothetical protein